MTVDIEWYQVTLQNLQPTISTTRFTCMCMCSLQCISLAVVSIQMCDTTFLMLQAKDKQPKAERPAGGRRESKALRSRPSLAGVYSCTYAHVFVRTLDFVCYIKNFMNSTDAGT